MKWVVVMIIAVLSSFSILKPQFPLRLRSGQANPNEAPVKQVTNHKITATPTVEVRKSFVLLDVPFTSQAPNGEWSDPRHQDGCEEAAALMAVLAMRQATNPKAQIPKDLAKKEIEKAWDWQVEKYGNARDTSAEDTAERILGRYFGINGYMVTLLHGYEGIIDELTRGNVVVVPVDGRGLNPNYTAPGPERHMILIRGYDDETGEFMTNDPGTRRGEKYRYKYHKLFDAIRDYPTGDHVPITIVEKKMIVISNSKF